MNVKRLEKLVQRLERLKKDEKSAGRFNMKFWGISLSAIGSDHTVLRAPVCNTQACLAGETVLMGRLGKIGKFGGIVGGEDTQSSIRARAIKYLGLNLDEARRLFEFQDWNFYGMGWPRKFEMAYRVAVTPEDRLQVAVDRVKHFIATEGTE